MPSIYGRFAVAISAASLILFAPPAQSHSDTWPVAAPQPKRVRITVTTASDAANAGTSTVKSLIVNPGADGLSLREAILATNNDPRRYAIRFAPGLKGADIRVGSATGIDLPPLTGGGVSIDGDIDGDGRPDVTLRGFRGSAYCSQAEFLCPAFRISSSRNRLHGLALRQFAIGVLFTPLPTENPQTPPESHQMFANNVVSGLVMTVTRAGIRMNWGSPQCDVSTGKREWACETHNTWSDTKFEGNTIETRGGGVSFGLSNSIGDRVQRFTITDNTIRIRKSPHERIGIHLAAGGGAGSVRNRISDVLITRNMISGDLDRGIRLGSGELVGDANVIERVRIIDNQVRSSNSSGFAINIFLGESSGLVAQFHEHWDLGQIQYGDRNVVRDVDILGNTLSGRMNVGVSVETGCCGGRGNKVRKIRIERNTIQLNGPFPVAGVHIDAGACCDSDRERHTSGNRVSDITIASNSITIETGRGDWEQNGGILLLAGRGESRAGRIRHVNVTSNRMDTQRADIPPINLLGGTWWLRSSEADGITLSDSFDGNRLACVVFRENLLDGVRDDLSVIVSAEHPDELSRSAQDAAWEDCGWEADDFQVASEEAAPGVASSSDRGEGGPPWPLILLGSAAALGAASLVGRFLIRK